MVFIRDFSSVEEVYGILGVRIKVNVMVKSMRFCSYLELEVDICLKILPKVYYKSIVAFVCERNDNLKSFYIDLGLCDV